MYLTKENAHEYAGKRLDAHKRRFHYYPLTVHEKNGEYFYSDRNGVWTKVPDAGDNFNSVQFDFVVGGNV